MSAKIQEKSKKGKNKEKPPEPLSLYERVNLEKKQWSHGHGRPVTREAFKLWLTIPTTFLGMPEDVAQKMGIDDRDILDILSIRTQKAFAEWTGVKEPVLSEWVSSLRSEKDAFKETKRFFKKLTRNVLAALYRKALTEGDAARISLYLKVIEDWKESFGLEHSGGIEYNLEPEEKAMLDTLLQRDTK